ncbi:AgrD family cyclic lactone autoinducer peptide [Desulfallas thermosapovorans]|uniref:Cyclic lactone autoinducer peptide n=1 Tax=Desulfallas thermosapovorans DSM 6562 TaxID=1121431 RepID=A0A5S4ZUM3_9FIRM|nr:cyclic lactone autoinducer peptide [Desulfallas thermosapovorans]TYO96494.1 cyclic lactone autoinducer peptide [Desulfallas thermosapovorans DSM 6562]
MKKITSRLWVFAVAALLLLAKVTAAAASACLISAYQPEVPEALRK